MENSTKSILDLATAGLKFLAPGEGSKARQTRKNIKLAFKNYKKICKEIKRNGITVEEQALLDTLLHQLATSQNKLI